MRANENKLMNDELDDSTPFEGDELDDSRPDEAGDSQDTRSEDVALDDPVQGQVVVVETAPGGKKKIIFRTLAGLCALTVGATLYGTIFSPEKNAAPGVSPVVMKTNASLDFESFVIPFHHENSHYVSFSISFRATEKLVLAELRQKREIFRGRIYDRLKALAARRASTLSPGVIKEIVADSVNEWLSAGNVEGVYIINFIVI